MTSATAPAGSVPASMCAASVATSVYRRAVAPPAASIAGIRTAPHNPLRHPTGWSRSPSARSRPGRARRSSTNARRSPPRSRERAMPCSIRPRSICFRSSPAANSTRHEVRDALIAAATTCQLVADDGIAAVEATINSGAQAGLQQPRTRPQPRARTGPRPTIKIVGGQLPRIVNETEDALVASGLPVFSRANVLVQPVAETMLAAGERKTVVAHLHSFNSDSLLRPVAESATFQRFNLRQNSWVEIDPPMQLVRTRPHESALLQVPPGERHHHDPHATPGWVAPRRCRLRS